MGEIKLTNKDDLLKYIWIKMFDTEPITADKNIK